MQCSGVTSVLNPVLVDLVEPAFMVIGVGIGKLQGHRLRPQEVNELSGRHSDRPTNRRDSINRRPETVARTTH